MSTTSSWRPGRERDGSRRARGSRARRPTPSRGRRAPWPAAGRASRAAAPPGRVPARALGLEVLGEVPGLPGRATRAPPGPRRARRRTRRRARARHRRPPSPPRRRPRTQRWRRPARWPLGLGAPVARRGVDGRHEVVGHVAAYGRLHGRPWPCDDRRHEGEGASNGPAPRHLGRVATRRLRSASMSTPLARTPTTRPRSCQAGPAQWELPPARTWPRSSDPAPCHPAGSRRTPGRDTVAAKSAGNAFVAGSPDLSREAGSVRSQPMRSLASGPAADATDGTGTRRFLRRKPTAFSTDPFSFLAIIRAKND